ncbi:U1 small nuclear ribonucleoprotein C-like [Carica papaya]|uniref:U1 small nuclear ribonucleoprotein C-like n=1 Tax=Carica papaya TaxID=3649 RepID=UPI000B8C8DE6|nr:U1 small nuclear ribonucleoprotein C-like [Carica papaya]
MGSFQKPPVMMIMMVFVLSSIWVAVPGVDAARRLDEKIVEKESRVYNINGDGGGGDDGMKEMKNLPPLPNFPFPPQIPLPPFPFRPPPFPFPDFPLPPFPFPPFPFLNPPPA